MTDERRTLLFRLLFVGLVAGNLLVAYDWWRTTEQGQEILHKLGAKLKSCQGCARRRQVLRTAINRMHWDAERIVEGKDVPTVPEPEAPPL